MENKVEEVGFIIQLTQISLKTKAIRMDLMYFQLSKAFERYSLMRIPEEP
jgi:hypothetical protein